ncbi:MAG: tRNA (adenosine(37)-N6)-threonylcarbamoyltransferase complex dimerization subunit type 1 TsaB [Saprospiraceae bacterium]
MHQVPLILSIDTSTDLCSVSFSRGPEIVDEEIYRKEDRRHAALLPLMIETVRVRAGLKLSEIAAICCSMGPGSYTGLRVGLSTAKGLCLALDKPLIGVSTLEALSYSVDGENDPLIRIVPLIDAGRDEVYHGVFDCNHIPVITSGPLIVREDSFTSLLSNGQRLILVGDGVSKTKAIHRPHPNLLFGRDEMVASLLSIPAFKKLIEGNFENVAYSVPEYIKAPVYKKYM